MGRKQLAALGSTSGAELGVLAIPGPLPYPGDPPAAGVSGTLSDACVPWHLEGALLEFDRQQSRPVSRHAVESMPAGARDATAADFRDVEAFAIELANRAAGRIQAAWRARLDRRGTRMAAAGDLELRRMEIASEEAAKT